MELARTLSIKAASMDYNKYQDNVKDTIDKALYYLKKSENKDTYIDLAEIL